MVLRRTGAPQRGMRRRGRFVKGPFSLSREPEGARQIVPAEGKTVMEHPAFVAPARIEFDPALRRAPVDIETLRDAVIYVFEGLSADCREAASIRTEDACYHRPQIREMYCTLRAEPRSAAGRH